MVVLRILKFEIWENTKVDTKNSLLKFRAIFRILSKMSVIYHKKYGINDLKNLQNFHNVKSILNYESKTYSWAKIWQKYELKNSSSRYS